MYELTVETEFCAAHALRIGGTVETLHGHNWHVTATLAGRELDADGLLVDFHEVQRLLGEILAPLANRDLGTVPPFDRVNPSAEQVARHLALSLEDRLFGPEPTPTRRVWVRSVRVTEAPGCSAIFHPAQPV